MSDNTLLALQLYNLTLHERWQAQLHDCTTHVDVSCLSKTHHALQRLALEQAVTCSARNTPASRPVRAQ